MAEGRTSTEYAGAARAAVGANDGNSDIITGTASEYSGILPDSNYGALADSSVVVVWAKSTASNHDIDGNGDATTTTIRRTFRWSR